MFALENKTIRLRALEPEDLDTIYKWENNAEIWYLGNTLIPFSKYTIGQFIQSANQDIYESRQLRLMIEIKESGRAVGAIDLFDFDPFNQRAGIGIIIGGNDDRKKGFASEAVSTLTKYCFETLMLRQIFCNITEDNEDSLKLFISQGFILTGQKREWIRTLDGWLTEYFLQKVNDVVM